MSQNKEGNEGNEKKPGVKIQDLSPKKDAKGGARVSADSASADSRMADLKSQDVRAADGSTGAN
ncbi:MAG: hypothetical protein M3128_09285 [Verrucomicrobiota bacterium]|nr:hypothetical protein [Verrucomicrobiota bacterium]